MVEFLLEHQADLDCRKYFCLLKAIQLVIQILTRGLFSCRDRFGGSALDDAVRHSHTHIQVQTMIFRSIATQCCAVLNLDPVLQRLLRGKGASLDVLSSALKMCEFAAR